MTALLAILLAWLFFCVLVFAVACRRASRAAAEAARAEEAIEAARRPARRPEGAVVPAKPTYIVNANSELAVPPDAVTEA